MRRWIRGVSTLVGSLTLGLLLAQESVTEPVALPDDSPAVTAVGTSLQVETTLLREDRARYTEFATRRQAIGTRIEQLRESLDSAVGRSGADATWILASRELQLTRTFEQRKRRTTRASARAEARGSGSHRTTANLPTAIALALRGSF